VNKFMRGWKEKRKGPGMIYGTRKKGGEKKRGHAKRREKERGEAETSKRNAVRPKNSLRYDY